MAHRPEEGAEAHCLGAEQRLDIDGLPAEADPEATERAPSGHIERLEGGRDIRGRETAERVDKLEHETAPGAVERQRLSGDDYLGGERLECQANLQFARLSSRERNFLLGSRERIAHNRNAVAPRRERQIKSAIA